MVTHTTNDSLLSMLAQRAGIIGSTTLPSSRGFTRHVLLLGITLALLTGTARGMYGAFQSWADSVSADDASQTSKDKGPNLLEYQQATLEEAKRFANLHEACSACHGMDVSICFECGGTGYSKQSFMTKLGETRQVHSGDKPGLAIRARYIKRSYFDHDEIEWLAATVVTPPSKDDNEVTVLFVLPWCDSTREEKIPVESTRVYDSPCLIQLEKKFQERLEALTRQRRRLEESSNENTHEEKATREEKTTEPETKPDHRITISESDNEILIVRDGCSIIECLRNAKWGITNTKWSNIGDAITGIVLACAAVNRISGNFDPVKWPTEYVRMAPTVSLALGPVRYYAFPCLLAAGLMKNIDFWCSTYPKMCALAGDDRVELFGWGPSVKKTWLATLSGLATTVGSIALCVTTLYGTGQKGNEGTIHRDSSIAVFGSIILNATCLWQFVKDMEEGMSTKQWLMGVVIVAAPMIATLVLSNFVYPTSLPFVPTTGDALCDDWVLEPDYTCKTQFSLLKFSSNPCPKSCNLNWTQESTGVPCDSIPTFPNHMRSAFAVNDTLAGGFAPVQMRYNDGLFGPSACQVGTGRWVDRYPSPDPMIPHPARQFCQFAFALTEWACVGLQLFASAKTNNMLHPNKRWFGCGRRRDARTDAPMEPEQPADAGSSPTAAEAAAEDDARPPFFARMWNNIMSWCPGRSQATGDDNVSGAESQELGASAAIPDSAEESATNGPSHV